MMLKAIGYFFAGLAALFVICVLGIAAGVVALPFHAASATVDTAHGVIDKTMNADNALFNYENFHDLYNGALQQAANIKNAEQDIATIKQTYGSDPSKWSDSVNTQYLTDQQNLDSYKQMYEKIVQEYNSDSQKINRAIFKSHNLPPELPLDYTQIQ